MCPETHHFLPRPLTFLASLLPGSVNVVFELDADLPLCGLVSDEGKLQQLLRWWAAQVGLDETRVNEVNKLLRPGDNSGSLGGPLGRGRVTGRRWEIIHPKANLTSLLLSPYPNTSNSQCSGCSAAPSQHLFYGAGPSLNTD